MSTGREMARQCRELGVQVNFAPVADVISIRRIPLSIPALLEKVPVNVADKVIAYARGTGRWRCTFRKQAFSRSWRYGCGFASFIAEVVVFACTRLDSVELYPFRKAIQAGLSGMMDGTLWKVAGA